MTEPKNQLDLSGLSPDVAKRVKPFLTQVVEKRGDDFRSIYIVGSAVTSEFSPDRSDFNTLFVLRAFSIDFLDFIAPLGKKFGRKRIQAPTIMTLEYIERSLDVYPVEFLQHQRVNRLVFGEDVLAGLQIDRGNLRLQIERELKGGLIKLRQGYIRAMGRRHWLRQLVIDSVPGLPPLMAGILHLLGRDIPEGKLDIVRTLAERLEIDLDPIAAAVAVRQSGERPGLIELKLIFEGMYHALDRLAGKVDDIVVS